MLSWFRRLLPTSWLSFYHRGLAVLGGWRYGHPSRSMIVVGVTGTNGKSSTVNFLSELLRAQGLTVGFTSTVMFHDGKKEWLNATKMTMLGRWGLQQMLDRMKKNHCDVAVVETSSEGIKQFRHLGIAYDVAVFTNLTPEHLESHGGFEAYKTAKQQLFRGLSKQPKKNFRGKLFPKTIVVNWDDPHASDFAGYSADQHLGYTFARKKKAGAVQGEILSVDAKKKRSHVRINGHETVISLWGEFNLRNALCALTTARAFGFEESALRDAMQCLQPVPGRLEFVIERSDLSVIVDYAPEPESMKQLYRVFDQYLKPPFVIHVLGSCGGGRDAARRPVLGGIAGEHADVVIVTNEDPYDDDPQLIIDQVAEGAKAEGKVEGKTLFRILDRRAAIRHALKLGQTRPRSLVLVTGKGSEQAMVVKNRKKLPWDDRVVIREELLSLKKLRSSV